MSSSNQAVVKTDSELSRLFDNQRSLLDVMPEMVFLVNGSKSIEYMNPSAIKFFGDLRENNKHTGSAYDGKTSALLRIVEKSLNDNNSGLQEDDIIGHTVEYSLAPFVGYKGEQLHWLVVKDLTSEKKQKEELERFHSNVENILTKKISEIKESDKIQKSLSKQLNTLKDFLEPQSSDNKMVGSSRAMTALREMIYQVAQSDATILVTGESGTGKELVANLICKKSLRRDKPFLKINCNAINESLLESDLFGYEKGAFTGAATQRKGKFEVVDGGTLFLDEIGDISPRMQAALLRVLQDGEIIRVGGNSTIKVDVRIVAATNMNLAKAVQDGSFRLDLYYRLNIINIPIPPLRSRKEDIIDLVTYFVKKYRVAFHKDINFVPESIIDKLISHSWPGNVRELENVIQRAVLMAKSNMITDSELFFDHQPNDDTELTTTSLFQKYEGYPLKQIIAEIERDIIIHTLEKNFGNAAKTAQELQIGKTAFYDKMKRYDISPKDHK